MVAGVQDPHIALAVLQRRKYLQGGAQEVQADHLEALDEASRFGTLGSAPATNKDQENKKENNPSGPAEDKSSMESSRSSPSSPPSNLSVPVEQRVPALDAGAEAQRVPPRAYVHDQDCQIPAASTSPEVLAKLALRIVDMIRNAQEHEVHLPSHTFEVVEELESIARLRDRDQI